MRPSDVFLSVAAAACLLSSCSVKEDRSSCPCCLRVSSLTALRGGARAYFFQSGEAAGSGDIPAAAGPRISEHYVPRGIVTACYIKSDGPDAPQKGGILIAEGTQCDSLFAHANDVDCSQEFASDTLELHKQFATLTVFFQDYPSPVGVTVRGHSCGMAVPSLAPVEGPFTCDLPSVGAGRYSVRLPRQTDGDLLMDIRLPDGKPLTTLPLGERIIDAGYDWTAEDLADIDLALDLTKSSFTVTIVPWRNGVQYAVDI